jgi:phage-related protein
MTDNGGFKIDGVPASTYGVTLAYAPGQPMLPGTRDRTIEIPGRAGLYWFDSDAGSRTFSLPCRFTGAADAAALDALIRVFARVLVHVYGRPRSLELEFDDSPGLKYLVRYNGQIPFDRAWCGCSEFTLDLIADDPYAYEPEDATTINITTSGSVPGTAISSSGNIETPAEFCFTNNGANPVVGFTVKVNYEVT